jgi:hypothetical protein
MIRFTLDNAVRAVMATRPRIVQVEIARLANLKVGYCPFAMEGIMNYYGGVRVRECDIAIYHEYAIDDWTKILTETTPEENAVVEAIDDLATAFKSDPNFLSEVMCPEISGHPLRDLLGL